jgi:hypothetical protein
MSMDEWRITKTTIETEMLRLVALLSAPFRTSTHPVVMHPGVARHEAEASNLALHAAVKAVTDDR